MKLDRRAGAYVLKADLVKVNIERRRRAEATEEWRKRYDIRAGIEGTNSELKRAHGLGRLRVRGGRRVRLAVYLKALACNFKRMVHARLVEMENTAQRAVGTVPAVAAHEGAAPQLPPGALSHGRGTARDPACPERSPKGGEVSSRQPVAPPCQTPSHSRVHL